MNKEDNTKEPTPKAPTPPKPDPLTMKREQLKQQLQQTNQQLMELRQQKAMFGDLIQSANDQAQQLVGALKLLEEIQNPKKE